MLKRPRLVVITLLVLLVVAVLALPVRTASQLKLAINSLFLPLFGLSDAVQGVAERAGNLAVPRRILLTQLEKAQQDNQVLRMQLAQAEETLRENNRFRQFYGFQQRVPWKFKLARVVGRDPANWWRSVLLDVGSHDGIGPNLPVMTPEGLVGRIERVGLKQSFVVLVGDPSCQVAALVQETRDNGIITPAIPASLDCQLVDLTHLTRGSSVQPGHKVVTSGLGGMFPKGIPVGDVVGVQAMDYGLYAEAHVRLSAQLNCLEEVWVMIP